MGGKKISHQQINTSEAFQELVDQAIPSAISFCCFSWFTFQCNLTQRWLHLQNNVEMLCNNVKKPWTEFFPDVVEFMSYACCLTSLYWWGGGGSPGLLQWGQSKQKHGWDSGEALVLLQERLTHEVMWETRHFSLSLLLLYSLSI